MADTKISALTAASSFLLADILPVDEAGTTKGVTGTQIRTTLGVISNNSTSTVSAGYAADTYLAGSSITVAAGVWAAGTKYRLVFDMTKTAAGVAAPVLTVRMGTLGTTGDAAILTFTFAAQTAAAHSGLFTIHSAFRTVGSGTSAVLAGVASMTHTGASTGLGNISSELQAVVSSGFNSTTQTIIGASFNGGGSFSGTCVLVDAEAIGL